MARPMFKTLCQQAQGLIEKKIAKAEAYLASIKDCNKAADFFASGMRLRLDEGHINSGYVKDILRDNTGEMLGEYLQEIKDKKPSPYIDALYDAYLQNPKFAHQMFLDGYDHECDILYPEHVVSNVIEDSKDEIAAEEENVKSQSYQPRRPDLFLGLKEIKVDDLPLDHETKWVLGTDICGVIPVVRSAGKYGLFRAVLYGMGMGPYAYYYASEPFKFDDVRICVPYMGLGHYNGYLATLQQGEWSIWAIDIDTHPLKIVEGCQSFEDAKKEMESTLGTASPYPWMTFDVYNENNQSLWASEL